VTQREREALAASSANDSDPHPEPGSLLFGFGDEHTGEFEPVRMTRADRRRSEQSRGKRTRRRGRLFVLLALLLVAAVAWLVVPRVVDYFQVPDYSGSGTGSVSVTVHTGDSASDIAATLKSSGVIKSTKAFTDAASDNSDSQSIQPGVYNLHHHMSGKAALDALLDPKSRNRLKDALVAEGATTLDVAATLTKLCGQGAQSAITAALASGPALGIPANYKVGTKAPSSAEGFLYPATYTLDPSCKPSDALQKMVSRFILQDRDTHFAASAAKVKLTPYQALIVASIAQSEAKYEADMPKVVRTILNRISSGTPLQFDSTSSYACKLAHQTRCIYNQVDSPYNTYTHKGLPPTPIDNPGAPAMAAAVHPAAGNYLFFVNKDKDGHLFFTNSDKLFEQARVKCVKNNWGCG
jgi:peptidoglycan lytic transglycosylase G